MSSRLLSDLEPLTRKKCQQLLDQSKAAGIPLLVTCTFRSADEQDKLYNSKPKVTNAKGGESWHNFRMAFDIAPIDEHGNPLWNRVDLFDKVGKIGQDLGLVWGGSWKSIIDKPHFEYHPGMTLEDAQKKWGRERPLT